MKFELIDEEEFTSFEKNHELSSFYQSVNWSLLKRRNGWHPFYFGVKKDNKIIASTLILKKTILKFFSIMYAPRGFLIDYNDYDLLSFFTKNIKKFAKKNHSIFVKIDPFVIKNKLDKNGNIIYSINNNTLSNLSKLKYKKINSSNIQPNTVFKLYFNNKTIDELFNDMETTTKQRINKAKKIGVTTRFINIDEIYKFKDIMLSTSKRRKFVDRPITYYENMYKIFKDEIKYMLGEININTYLNNITKELEYVNDKIKILEDKCNNKLINQIKELNILKTSLLKKLNNAIEIKNNNKEDIVVLGGLMFIMHNKDVISLFGGAYKEYKDFLPAYLLNYNMICYAKENNYESYNFYGISEYKDKTNEMYGLYEFKKGFNGVIEEYIGEYDLVINKLLYFIYTKLFKLFKYIKNK